MSHLQQNGEQQQWTKKTPDTERGRRGEKTEEGGRRWINGSSNRLANIGDLKQKLQFPQQIAVTNQRPNIVIWSASTNQAILLEPTVPWEERIEDANERKRLKYQDLLEECRDNGWRFGYFQWKWEAKGVMDSLCGEH
ncbi:Hypothetical predicted protein [Mytilus galloprovincialis]|uniref:Uncharacterized protein n=1 Tax=Mytilus galloprovincialis TaxID=29158 RepID=A0A8B6DMY8_MYTGA|nr:Hypothetical predicted protein [Mytilus galloprovincialis]